MSILDRMDSVKSYSVYKHTCPNGEVYIGITKSNVEDRWKEGEGYRGQWFFDAVEKFGWKNIKHEVLLDGLNREFAVAIETDLIILYASWVPGRGYNDTLGENYRRMFPVRNTYDNFVYPSIDYCVDFERAFSKGVVYADCTFHNKGIYEYCNCDNVSDKDIYIVGDIKISAGAIVDIQKVISIIKEAKTIEDFENKIFDIKAVDYIALEKIEKPFLSFEEGYHQTLFEEPRLEGKIWKIPKGVISEKIIRKIIQDYISELDITLGGLIVYDPESSHKVDIYCNFRDILKVYDLLLEKYDGRNVVEIGVDRFLPYVYPMLVLKLNYDCIKLDKKSYSLFADETDFSYIIK